jgi:hypothetical protein
MRRWRKMKKAAMMTMDAMKAIAIPATEEAFKVLDETVRAGIDVDVGLSVEELSVAELLVVGLTDVDVDESPGVVYFYFKNGQLL